MPKRRSVVTIMCGLPRSGKSTWIKKNKGEAIVVSPDEIRSKIFGHQFFKSAEDFIWAMAKAIARLLLEQRKDIVIDATSITMSSRNEWIKLAEQYKANVRIVWMRTSIRKCLERNNTSPEGKKLPDEVIRRMAMVFEDPSVDYHGRKVEIVQYPRRKAKSSEAIFENSYMAEIREMIEEESKNG